MRKAYYLSSALVLCLSCSAPELNVTWNDTDGPFPYDIWRGEQANTTAVIVSDSVIENIELEIKLTGRNSGFLPKDAIKASFVDYVMADVIDTSSYGQCGYRKKGQYDSLMVADIISNDTVRSVVADKDYPVWITADIPQDAPAGKYQGRLLVKRGRCRKASLPFEINVIERVLPESSDWKFHLDLWQNPYAVARYHNVELWSEEHFSKMRPVMEILASAGQKSVTATILDRPWNGQTYDAFSSMVSKIKHSDGGWTYDYSIFDKWVEFMAEVGINAQINCYSMIPWALKFDYIDNETGEQFYIEAKPQSKEYKDYWVPFLSDFARHLKEKGWFEKTIIAMDERPLEAMLATLEVIHSAEPDFKVSLAGNYYEELNEQLWYVCIPFNGEYPDGICESRRASGKWSTFYTCCAEAYPNTFMASSPYEASWLPLYALASGLDGYLRWAYNSWTEDPMIDTRFKRWASGDCFLVYPDGKSSVRMQRLIEGIQAFEKASILIDEWTRDGEQEMLDGLNEALSAFSLIKLIESGAEDAVKAVRKLL